MHLYIKEWPDNTATLMTEHGRFIGTFASLEEAAESGYEVAEAVHIEADEIELDVKAAA